MVEKNLNKNFMTHETYKLLISVSINKAVLEQPSSFIYIWLMATSDYSSGGE